ncbi:MAG TPA: hypothetical protein VFS15_22555 [Kofleriaceae bacterium]|nr:hypothetical protein [Kofleriaceae bacterium]
MAKPLTPKAQRFAEVYAGDGVAAAREAGYTGTPGALAVTASRLLKDERVQRVIAGRKKGLRRVSVEQARAEAEASGVDPIAVLEELATDTTVHPASRVAAAKALERHRRATHASDADPFAELRAKINELTKARLERERETGRCASCGAPLERE